MKAYIFLFTAWLTVSCAATSTPNRQSLPNTEPTETIEAKETELKPGSNEMLRASMTMAEGLEVIISDVVIPPNATVPLHYHPGEEFIYVLEGSAVHVEEGKPEQVLKAGDTYVIPPEAKHSPRGGEEGARAVVFRVHVEGQPERILVEED